MLGTDFKRTLRSAQAGDEPAFVRLWRDANPAMIRYLRVAGVDDPYDAACEGWISVVRGLSGFTGDETGWRVWVLACARLRAEEGSLRRRWGSVTVLPGIGVEPIGEPLDVDELDEAGDHLVNRGLNETIAAVRDLPLGQGEILMLRLAAGLPVSAVADIVGTDAVAVRRSEERALERLGADRELIAWSLEAPAMPAELADERVATAAFRSIPRPSSAAPGGTRVIALGLAGQSRRGTRARLAAGRSRAALVGAAAVSASVMSLGGLSAAAYVGALPDGIQQLMHHAIGAPPPSLGPKAIRGEQGSPGSGAVGPDAAGSPAAGLCRAWSSDKAKGTARDRSVAFRNLATAAGGASKVDVYCAKVAADKATRPTGSATPSDTPGSHSPTAKPTQTHPTHAPATSTKAPKTANPRSTQSGRPAKATTTPPQTAEGAPAGGVTAPATSPTAPSGHGKGGAKGTKPSG